MMSVVGAFTPFTLPPTVKFYDPDIQAKDYKGRTLSEILSWDDAKLESCHDYIQVLFPLPEPEPHNRSAPLINLETMECFRYLPYLRDQMRKAVVRMLEFYGFSFVGLANGKEEIAITCPWTFNDRAWLRDSDHNHQRITRILRCLRILGLFIEAQLFYKKLRNLAQSLKRTPRPKHLCISDRSVELWMRAMTRPLNFSLDDVQCGHKKPEREFLLLSKKRRRDKWPYLLKEYLMDHCEFARLSRLCDSLYNSEEANENAVGKYCDSLEDQSADSGEDQDRDQGSTAEKTQTSKASSPATTKDGSGEDQDQDQGSTADKTQTSKALASATNNDSSGKDQAQDPTAEKAQASKAPTTTTSHNIPKYRILYDQEGLDRPRHMKPRDLTLKRKYSQSSESDG